MSAIVANEQLVLKERTARDMQYWDLLHNSYARDGQVRVSWYSGHINGFVEGSKQIASRPGLQVLHVLQPPVVWLNKDETRGAVVLGAVITSRSRITDDAKQDVLVDIESHSRLMYTTVIEDGEWKIRSVDCVYLKDGIKAVLPGGHLVIRPQSLSNLRPSYQMLAWTIMSRGIPVNHDLPGVDRPESLRRIQSDVFAWVDAKDMLT